MAICSTLQRLGVDRNFFHQCLLLS